jgi:hypothetical protein
MVWAGAGVVCLIAHLLSPEKELVRLRDDEVAKDQAAQLRVAIHGSEHICVPLLHIAAKVAQNFTPSGES